MAVETTEKLLLSASEVAAALGISRSAFYSLLSSGRIGPVGIRFGRSVRYDRREMENWLSAKNPVNGSLPNREQWVALQEGDR